MPNNEWVWYSHVGSYVYGPVLSNYIITDIFWHFEIGCFEGIVLLHVLLVCVCLGTSEEITMYTWCSDGKSFEFAVLNVTGLDIPFQSVDFDIVHLCRETALAEMGIAVRKGETVGVFQPKKVTVTWGCDAYFFFTNSHVPNRHLILSISMRIPWCQNVSSIMSRRGPQSQLHLGHLRCL